MKNKSEKTCTRLKFVRTISICLLIIVISFFGLYKFVTYQWQDEPKTYNTTNQYITKHGETMVSAHRAGKNLFPQSTMMAFEGCAESKTFRTDIFEFDLHLTADDKLIILHDDTLDEVSDAVEYFGKTDNYPQDYTYEQICNLNFGETFKNEKGETPFKNLRGDDIPDNLRVATVTEALTYLEDKGGFYYIIEIKNSGELGFKAADILYDILSEMNLIDKAIVGTFNADVTSYLDEKYPDLTRSASTMEVVGLYIDSLLDADREEGYYKFDVLQVPPDKYVVNIGTTKFVNYAHENNIAVQYWTINDTQKMMFLQDIGADCIITDNPDVAYKVLNRQNKG